jgi:hypothetical protein
MLTEVGVVPEHKDTLRNTRDGLPLLKHWYKTCCEMHIECNHDSEPKTFPTRLIDIMDDPQHLCLGDSLSQDTPYVTSSHCWGSNTQVMNLQKCNLQSFLHLIPPEALPKTFQDDSEDWARESALMSDVYGSSAINIAATGAEDTNQGCFFDRRDGWGCRFTTHFEEGELDAIGFPRSLEVRGLQQMPLSLRGWALQERILPTGLSILRKHNYFGNAMRSDVVKHSRLVTRQKLLIYYP